MSSATHHPLPLEEDQTRLIARRSMATLGGNHELIRSENLINWTRKSICHNSLWPQKSWALERFYTQCHLTQQIPSLGQGQRRPRNWSMNSVRFRGGKGDTLLAASRWDRDFPGLKTPSVINRVCGDFGEFNWK